MRRIFIPFGLLAAFIILGCVGSPVHRTLKYNAVQSTIEKNNQDLMNLQGDMIKSCV
jgi:hypothetical protein